MLSTLRVVALSLLLTSAALADPPSKVIRLGTAVKQDEIKDASFIESVAFTSDSKSVFAGKGDGTLLIYDIASGKQIASIKAHDEKINTIVRRGDKLLLTASQDGQVKEWDATGKAIRTVAKMPESQGISAMAISNSQKKLALGVSHEKDRLVICDVTTGKITQKMAGARTINKLAFAPDDLTLLVAGHEVMQMWNLQASTRIWQKGQEPKADVISIDSPFHSGSAFGSDKKFAASTIDAQTGAYILIWDAKSGKGHTRIQTRSGHVHFAFSPDAQWIALGGNKPEVVIYNVKTGELAHDLAEPGEPGARVLSIAFSPDGKRLATGAIDGTVTVWKTEGLAPSR